MRLIKLALISIAGLFVLATLMTSLLPSEVIVSRAINVETPADSVLVRIRDLRQWKNWIDGMNDTSVNIISATQARLGGTDVTITRVSATAVQSTWRTRNGHLQVSTMNLIFSPAQHITVVQWQFQQRLSWYPWEKLGSIMNDKIIGPMMEKNLGNLKKTAENTN